MRYKKPFQLVSTCEDSPSSGVKTVKIIFQLVLVDKYVFNWYLKMTTRGSNGLLIEIKHKFVISPMIKRDGHK